MAKTRSHRTIRKSVKLSLSGVLLLFAAACDGSSGITSANFDSDMDDAEDALDSMSGALENIEAGELNLLPIDESMGPMERITAYTFNRYQRDSIVFTEAASAAGLEELLAFTNITPQSNVLNQCDEMAALQADAERYRGRVEGHMQAARAYAERQLDNRSTHREFLAGFDASADEGIAQADRNWQLNGLIATEAANLCRVLARRNWILENGRAAFTNDNDLAEFNRYASLLDSHLAELQQSIQRQATAVDQARAQTQVAR